MKNTILLALLLFLSFSDFSFAQDQAGGGFHAYSEREDPDAGQNLSSWQNATDETRFHWGNTGTRYSKTTYIPLQKTIWKTKAWRGERINAQAVIVSKRGVPEAQLSTTGLKSNKGEIPSRHVSSRFVRYVMTDELSKDGRTGCGHRENRADWDSSLIADVLDVIPFLTVEKHTVQPVWIQIDIPTDTRPGIYRGELVLSGKNITGQALVYEVEVLPRTLPVPGEWSFHLDLWQNPYAVARYHQVPLWSEEHFNLMRPVMKQLAAAGQKVITTSIMHKPWNGQTYDYFDSMVYRMKKIDGSWVYDYTVLDTWVEFMMETDIDQLINCYTVIPWALRFDYIDQATNDIKFIEAKPGEVAYADYWISFLKDFSRHLREKGWFEKTTIAMDERPMEAMQEAIKVIKTADPGFKISLAGNYHPEIEEDLYDYCVAYGQTFPEEILAGRKAENKISTVYTCCAEPFPNTFTFSPPAEATWLPWHAAGGCFDGYLRWAYNSWTEDPLRDTRFRTWAAGDCYLIYPGARSSIRLEKLIEGIQDYEKIRILRKEFANKNNRSKLNRLNKTVATFTPDNLDPETMEEKLQEARNLLNTL